jgi:hypothetical protein
MKYIPYKTEINESGTNYGLGLEFQSIQKLVFHIFNNRNNKIVAKYGTIHSSKRASSLHN